MPAATATTAVGGNAWAGMSGIPSPADLPTRWIDYSGLDLVYVELDELEPFVEQNPAQWRAIRQWLSAGGNLWVAKVGTQWEHIGRLEKLLDLPASGRGNDPPGWEHPDPKDRHDELHGLGRAYSNPAATPATPATPGNVKRKGQETVRFRTRAVGLGQVMAFGHDDPLEDIQDSQSWNWIYNTAGAERWSWYRRHGLSLHRENPDFWEFLIPGVGLAPVTEFQVLITLFVLAIGPLNYFLLRRWGKLNLIMITVPVSALAITATLLLYALVADGLSVRVRARSFTQIDQRRGEAVCWSRLSYYAGLRPSQGLSFPTDTAVYPIEHEAHENRYGNSRERREIDWRQTQDLGNGWLNARTPTQLLTVSARPAKHRLVVAESNVSPPVVENLLGTQIQRLVLIDSQGQLFEGEDLAAGDKTTLKPSTAAKAGPQWVNAYNSHRPQRPPGMTSNHYSLFGVSRRYSSIYYGQQYDMDTATLRASVLERNLAEAAGSTNHMLNQPRSYIAIVERSPEMSFGLKSVQEEDSFHVIVGRW
jgi:hypothetical protein